MLRTFVCALVALVMAAGLCLAAEAKAKRKRVKGKVTVGKFVSFKDGKLTITPVARKGKKKGDAKKADAEGSEAKVEDKTFEVEDGTTVIVRKEGSKPQKLKSPEAFKGIAKGTRTVVLQNKEDKVLRVTLGKGKGKGKKKKKADE